MTAAAPRGHDASEGAETTSFRMTGATSSSFPFRAHRQRLQYLGKPEVEGGDDQDGEQERNRQRDKAEGMTERRQGQDCLLYTSRCV